MTSLRQAAQQALEAMETVELDIEWRAASPTHKMLSKAITALRAALAEPQIDPVDEYRKGFIAGQIDMRDREQAEPVQEPVTWRWGYRSVTTGEMDWRGYVEIPAHPSLRSPEIIMEPLYTAPPQRKPLTDEEIDKITVKQWGRDFMAPAAGRTWARAIERAHGIGEKE